MKKISLFLFALLLAFGISAQGTDNVSYGDVYLKNKASNNWFISLAGGTNSYYGSGSQVKEFVDNLGWEGQFAIGKWNSPKWGTRLAVNVGSHKHLDVTNAYVKDAFIHPHVDLLWNVTSNKGVYNFIPFVGAGYFYGMTDDFKKVNPSNPIFKGQNQSLSWNLGVINDFRFSKNFSVFVELSATTVQSAVGRNYSAQTVGDWDWDIMGQALLGVKFGLGGREFTKAELMDYGLVNDLNAQINKLQAENENLSNRPEFCPECPKVEVQAIIKESVYVPNVVFFRLNSAVIDTQQQLNIKETAEYLKSNPKAKVQVVAYADKNTGNPDYNMKLSEKRAKVVADALTNEYAIKSDRISLDWKGDTTQPYTENDWNRVAIFILD